MLADIPTVAEAIPEFELDNWYGMVVPAGTPRVAIQRLREDMVKAMNVPDIREKLPAVGQVPVSSALEEFAAFMKSEGAKWLKVIKQGNITPS